MKSKQILFLFQNITKESIKKKKKKKGLKCHKNIVNFLVLQTLCWQHFSMGFLTNILVKPLFGLPNINMGFFLFLFFICHSTSPNSKG